APAGDRPSAVRAACLQEVQAGGRPDRRRYLAEHPELAAVLDCLETLEKLAPPPAIDEAPTADFVPAGDETAAPPADLDRYEVLGELGRGGMGVVYKARQKDLGRLVALKMILSSHLAAPDQVARFRDEARAAAGLQHPNVVAVYEAGELHGQPYIAMQYVPGPSLAAVLRRGPLPAEEAARGVAAVARAVAHLHAHGIVHRDLKPSNILLDEDNRPYVTDFGLVTELN